MVETRSQSKKKASSEVKDVKMAPPTEPQSFTQALTDSAVAMIMNELRTMREDFGERFQQLEQRSKDPKTAAAGSSTEQPADIPLPTTTPAGSPARSPAPYSRPFSSITIPTFNKKLTNSSHIEPHSESERKFTLDQIDYSTMPRDLHVR